LSANAPRKSTDQGRRELAAARFQGLVPGDEPLAPEDLLHVYPEPREEVALGRLGHERDASGVEHQVALRVGRLFQRQVEAPAASATADVDAHVACVPVGRDEAEERVTRPGGDLDDGRWVGHRGV
jgi:hypothetical protein